MAGHSDDDGDGEYTDGYGYACDDDVEVGEGSPNEKRQRKSAAGRKLIRWSCEVDQLVLLCVDQVCTKQGVAIPWDLVGKEINDTLTGEAIKQHLVKMKKAREQHGQQVPDSLGAAEPRKSAAATPLKTRSIKAKNQEEKKSMKDAPLRHLVYLPEKKTPTKSRGKKMPNNVDTIKSTPSKTSTSKASDSVTTPPADEVQPGSRSSKRARRPSKKAAVEDANDSEAGSPSKKVKVAKPQVGEALSPTRWLKVTKPELGSSSKKAKVTKPEVDIPSKKANVTQPQPQQRPMRDTKLRNLPKLDYRELHVEEENEVAGIQGIKTSRAVAGNVEPTPSFQRTSLGYPWSHMGGINMGQGSYALYGGSAHQSPGEYDPDYAHLMQGADRYHEEPYARNTQAPGYQMLTSTPAFNPQHSSYQAYQGEPMQTNAGSSYTWAKPREEVRSVLDQFSNGQENVGEYNHMPTAPRADEVGTTTGFIGHVAEPQSQSSQTARDADFDRFTSTSDDSDGNNNFLGSDEGETGEILIANATGRGDNIMTPTALAFEMNFGTEGLGGLPYQHYQQAVYPSYPMRSSDPTMQNDDTFPRSYSGSTQFSNDAMSSGMNTLQLTRANFAVNPDFEADEFDAEQYAQESEGDHMFNSQFLEMVGDSP